MFIAVPFNFDAAGEEKRIVPYFRANLGELTRLVRRWEKEDGLNLREGDGAHFVIYKFSEKEEDPKILEKYLKYPRLDDSVVFFRKSDGILKEYWMDSKSERKFRQGKKKILSSD